MSRAVIITSYLEYPMDISVLIRPDDTVICLDGGYEIAMEQGIIPDILLGDFDSLDLDPASIRADHPNLKIMEYPPEKDFTDLELALKIVDPREFPCLLVIGGIGGRLDQTAVNLQLVARYTAPAGSVRTAEALDEDAAKPGSFDSIEMMDGRNRCFPIYGGRSCNIPAQPYTYLSLLPVSDVCRGVTLSGAKYPLDNATLLRGASLGVSNEFSEPVVKLSLLEGTLMVICSRA